MGFLKTLFGGGGPPDPTKDWPAPDPGLPTPTLDLYHRRFGTLEFDKSPPDQARYLGRPKDFKWEGSPNFSLYYLDHGYGIGFEHNLLVDALYEVGNAGGATHFRGFASPEILAGEEGTLLVDRSTTREEIEGVFGAPLKIDEDEDEVILTYRRNHLQLEFELTGATLTTLNVFSTMDEVSG